MASKKVFYDEDNNEMEFYVNDKNKLYVHVGVKGDDMQYGFITLDKDDVKDMIKMLQEFEPDVN